MKVVVVTGTNRGIGKSIKSVLKLAGYFVISVNRSNELLSRAELLVETDSEIEIGFDLRNSEGYEGLKMLLSSHRIYGVVNNAGVCIPADLEDISFSDLEETLIVNLLSPFRLSKLVLDLIDGEGRIINISSQLGVDGRAGYSAYSAAKFGLIGATKCWAKELGQRGITVNAICPGWVSTDMSKIDLAAQARRLNKDPEDFFAEICEPLELKRFNTPDEVAHLVEFLISEKGGGITGREFLMQTVWNQC
ncbi:MAG: SDR family NAD(P)-dependent oxidoreductase [Verrucomicrobiales bacterium]|nr:SDR family NAD(P)-dependent oxidoreductase [Verrucomicrobiales bacterium]